MRAGAIINEKSTNMQTSDFPELSEEEWAAETGDRDLPFLDSAEGIALCLKKMPKGMAPLNDKERAIINQAVKAHFTLDEMKRFKAIKDHGSTEDGDFHYFLIWMMPLYHTTYVSHVNHYYDWLANGRPWAHSERLTESLVQSKMRGVCLGIARQRQNSRKGYRS